MSIFPKPKHHESPDEIEQEAILHRIKPSSLIKLVGASFFLYWGCVPFLSPDYSLIIRFLSISVILFIGTVFVLRVAGEVIENSTTLLSLKTGLASGMLQSLGTAVPDMSLGIMAAFISIQVYATDKEGAISFAILAASITFSSNIYNSLYATWCVWRQNQADRKHKRLALIPGMPRYGEVKPIHEHEVVPAVAEVDEAEDIINAVSALTVCIAILMVLFGQVRHNGDGALYRLIQPIGVVMMILCLWIFLHFRKSKRASRAINKKKHHTITRSPNYIAILLFDLFVVVVSVIFAAKSMVEAAHELGVITHMPFILVGTLSGIIGCLSEMLVVHHYTVNPTGRIGDALVAVGMDNVVTILGAMVVAVIGGIFLGGRELILIFMAIMMSNTLLIWQMSKFKNTLFAAKR